MLGCAENLFFKPVYWDNIPTCYSEIHGVFVFVFSIPKLSSVFGVIKWLQAIGPAQISWKGDEKAQPTNLSICDSLHATLLVGKTDKAVTVSI